MASTSPTGTDFSASIWIAEKYLVFFPRHPANSPVSVFFSPTGRRLVYVLFWEDPLILYVQDLNTGEKTSLPIDIRFDEAGNFIWSPDGLLLALALADNPSTGESDHPPTLSVMVVNMADGVYDTVMSGVTDPISLTALSDDGLLTYQDRISSVIRRLDTVAGQCYTIGTATP